MRIFVVHFKTEAKGNGCQFGERQNGFWRRASTLGRIEGCAKWLQAQAKSIRRNRSRKTKKGPIFQPHIAKFIYRGSCFSTVCSLCCARLLTVSGIWSLSLNSEHTSTAFLIAASLTVRGLPFSSGPAFSKIHFTKRGKGPCIECPTGLKYFSKSTRIKMPIRCSSQLRGR